MKNFIVCLIFLISFANAIQCYNGKNYVDIPESKLTEIGYTKYNITHSNFDCKMAYKRYLKIKEIKPVNVSYETKNEKNELKEEPNKMGSFLPIFLLVIIVCVIWLIKNVIKDEPQDEWYSVTQKEPIKQKEIVSIKSVKKEPEYFRNWDVLIKLEKERQKKEREYFDVILGKNYPVKQVEQVKTEYFKSWDDLSKEYSENLKKIEQERQKHYPVNPVEKTVKPVQKSDKTYEELLTKQEWYDFRKKVVYDRGGYVCEFCKKKHNLQIHHKLYYKKPNKEKIEPWLYNMDEVLLLCDNCHKSVHKKNKIKVYYISYSDYDKRKVGFYNDFKQS